MTLSIARVLLCLGLSVAAGDVRGGEPSTAPTTSPSTRPADLRSVAKFKIPVPVRFEKKPLEQVLTDFAKSASLSIYIDRKAFERENAEADLLATPVTLNIADPLPLKHALRLVFYESNVPAECFIEDNVLNVTTHDGAHLVANVETRAYDTAALLLALQHDVDPDDLDVTVTRQELSDGLLRIIMEVAAPETWKDTGGSVGSIREFAGKLIITTTPSTHDEVAELLDQLAAAPARIPIRRAAPNVAGVPQAGDEVDAGQLALGDANMALALDVLPQLSKKGEQLVFSPYSLWTTAGVLRSATRGPMQAELAAMLHLPAGGDHQSSLARLRARLFPPLSEVAATHPTTVQSTTGQSTKGQSTTAPAACAGILEMNSTWFSGTAVPLRPEFIQSSKTDFDLVVKALNFDDPLAAAEQINATILKQTHGLVSNSVTPDELGRAPTAFVLVNTLYFKSAWRTPFDPQRTKPQPFFVSQGKPHDVAMMSLETTRLDYADGREFRSLRIPYADERFSMLVILPTPHQDLADVEKTLTPGAIQRVLDRLRPRQVDLYLPRFSIVSSHDLKPPLQALGVRTAFEPLKADFAAATAAPAYALWVKQQAVIIVNEQGTEAGAATWGGGGGGTVPGRPTSFCVDHPALIFILDNATGTPLFVVRLTDPAEAAEKQAQ